MSRKRVTGVVTSTTVNSSPAADDSFSRSEDESGYSGRPTSSHERQAAVGDGDLNSLAPLEAQMVSLDPISEDDAAVA
jgi:hypothetical protein